MNRRLIAGVLVSAGVAYAGASQPSLAAGTACSNLAALTIPNVTVNAATLMPPGFTVPGPQQPGAASSPLPAVTESGARNSRNICFFHCTTPPHLVTPYRDPVVSWDRKLAISPRLPGDSLDPEGPGPKPGLLGALSLLVLPSLSR